MQAQAFPSKPVLLVVTYPPGGGSNIVARALGRRIAEVIGRTVVIDNRAGANGNIGTEHGALVRAVKAPPSKGRFDRLGSIPLASTPQEFAACIRDELVKWARVVKASGARIDERRASPARLKRLRRASILTRTGAA